MIDYVMDCMEHLGVAFDSREEMENTAAGIRLYLLENGISEQDTRGYFRQYLRHSLSRVDRQDLKRFFLVYPIISRVNQICMEYRARGQVSESRKAELLNDMSTLFSVGLGDKYVPAAEVSKILGKLA